MRFPLSIRIDRDVAWGAALALAAFAVYLTTLAPSVGFMDGGELSTVASTLGVAHPTGYPLFTLLGRAFIAALPFGSAAWKLNLLGALLTAFAVFAFHRFARSLAALFPRLDSRLGALAGAGALAFSSVFWSEAVYAEVYALHLALSLFAARLFVASLSARPDAARVWLLFAYALGLSFANHMMTVLLAPAFLYLFFRTLGLGRAAWARVLAAIPPFLLGLSPYLYLPVRASADPAVNWGDPSGFEAFWRHVSAGQYRAFMFPGLETSLGKAGEFFAAVPADFGYLPLFAALAGAAFLWRVSRRLLAFVLLLFATGVAYVAAYDFDDPNFYLTAHVALALCVAAGTGAVANLSRRPGARAAAVAAALACVAAPLFLNHGRVDASEDHAAEDYARNMFASLDSGAVLFTSLWEEFIAPSWYLQRVEGLRPDVRVVAVRMWQHPWDVDRLERRDPELASGAAAEIAALRERQREARRASGIPAEASDAFVRALVRSAFELGPVYVTPEVAPRLWNDRGRVGWIPSGLGMRLFREGEDPGFREVGFRVRPLGATFHHERLRDEYMTAYVNQGIQLAMTGRPGEARALFRRALAMRPGHRGVLEWLARVEGRAR